MSFQKPQKAKDILRHQHHFTHNSHFHFAADDIRLSRGPQSGNLSRGTDFISASHVGRSKQHSENI